jgi:hypothetical protein
MDSSKVSSLDAEEVEKELLSLLRNKREASRWA